MERSPGEHVSGTMPKLKERVLVIGTVTATATGYDLKVEEVRRDNKVIIGRPK